MMADYDRLFEDHDGAPTTTTSPTRSTRRTASRGSGRGAAARVRRPRGSQRERAVPHRFVGAAETAEAVEAALDATSFPRVRALMLRRRDEADARRRGGRHGLLTARSDGGGVSLAVRDLGPSGATAGGALTSTAAARAAADVRRQDGRHGPVQQELTGFACDVAHGPLVGTRRAIRARTVVERTNVEPTSTTKIGVHRRQAPGGYRLVYHCY